MRLFAAVIIMVSLSCCNHGQGGKEPDQLLEAEDTPWENGQEVAISGVIYPSKANARFYLQTEKGAGVHIKHGTDIDILEAGTKLRVKGTIEYVPYEKPEDYDEKRYGVKFPQTICYIKVEEFSIGDGPCPPTPPPGGPSQGPDGRIEVGEKGH